MGRMPCRGAEVLRARIPAGLQGDGEGTHEQGQAIGAHPRGHCRHGGRRGRDRTTGQTHAELLVAQSNSIY